MEPKRSKYDTNPLDEDAAQRAERSWSRDTAGQEAPTQNMRGAATRDIGFREICTVAPLLGLSLFLGFYPKPVLDRLEKSVAALVTQVDTHSNHKTPTVGTTAAAEKCVSDSNGHVALGPCPKKPGK